MPATWVLSNHDVDRVVSRYGRADTAFSLDRRPYFHGFPVDLTLGTRRARAAALLTMALPGSVYIYQGEELGLWEVQDIPDELRQDPIWARTGGADPGRDGSRVPLPWSGTEPPFGFSPAGAAAAVAAAAQGVAGPDRFRGDRQPRLDAHPVPARAAAAAVCRCLFLGVDVVVPVGARSARLRRGASDGVRCVLANLSGEPVALPSGASVLLASGPLTEDGLLPADTTAWVRRVDRDHGALPVRDRHV